MASLTKDFSWQFGAQLTSIVIGLASQSCLAWYLEPAGRGSYAVCVLYATMLSLLFVVGFGPAAQYLVASRKVSISQGIVNAGTVAALGVIPGMIAGFFCTWLPVRFFERAEPKAFMYALILLPLTVMTPILVNLFGSLQDFGAKGVLLVAKGLLQLALLLLLVAQARWGVEGALLSLIGCELAIALAALVLFRWRHGLEWTQPSLRTIREMLGYGVRFHLGKISNQANFQMGSLVLAFSAVSESQIGLFAQAAALENRVMTVPDALSTVIFPRVAGDRKGRPALIAQTFRVSLVMCGLMLAGLVIFAEPFVRVVFSEQFLDCVPLIRILSIGILFRACCKMFVPYLAGTNHPGIASAASALGAGTNVVLLYFLLAWIGLPGAAWAMTASYVLSSLVLLMAFRKLSGVSLGELLKLDKSDWTRLADVLRRVRAKLPTSPRDQQIATVVEDWADDERDEK